MYERRSYLDFISLAPTNVLECCRILPLKLDTVVEPLLKNGANSSYVDGLVVSFRFVDFLLTEDTSFYCLRVTFLFTGDLSLCFFGD